MFTNKSFSFVKSYLIIVLLIGILSVDADQEIVEHHDGTTCALVTGLCMTNADADLQGNQTSRVATPTQLRVLIQTMGDMKKIVHDIEKQFDLFSDTKNNQSYQTHLNCFKRLFDTFKVTVVDPISEQFRIESEAEAVRLAYFVVTSASEAFNEVFKIMYAQVPAIHSSLLLTKIPSIGTTLSAAKDNFKKRVRTQLLPAIQKFIDEIPDDEASCATLKKDITDIYTSLSAKSKPEVNKNILAALTALKHRLFATGE